MSYSIIGFGNIGRALAKAFSRKGIEVSVATTRDPESFAADAAAIGPKVIAKTLAEVEPGGAVLIGVRPHDLVIGEAVAGGLKLEGIVTAVEPLGSETLVHFDVAGQSVIATAPGKLIPAPGSTITAYAAPLALYLFDAKTEKSLGRL